MEELNNATPQGQDNSTPETETENRTYTQEEVDKLLQSEVDRRITSALQKQEKKNQQKIVEAQRLAQMSSQEKYEWELKQRELAIEEKERQLTLAENKNTCTAILADKGLPLSIVDFCLAEDAETMNANINAMERAFKSYAKAQIERIMGGKTPSASTADPSKMTKEQFNKLSLPEQQRIYNEDRELYKQLTS